MDSQASANLSDGRSMDISLEIPETEPNSFPLTEQQESVQDVLNGLLLEVKLHAAIYRRFLILPLYYMYDLAILN